MTRSKRRARPAKQIVLGLLIALLGEPGYSQVPTHSPNEVLAELAVAAVSVFHVTVDQSKLQIVPLHPAGLVASVPVISVVNIGNMRTGVITHLILVSTAANAHTSLGGSVIPSGVYAVKTWLDTNANEPSRLELIDAAQRVVRQFRPKSCITQEDISFTPPQFETAPRFGRSDGKGLDIFTPPGNIILTISPSVTVIPSPPPVLKIETTCAGRCIASACQKCGGVINSDGVCTTSSVQIQTCITEDYFSCWENRCNLVSKLFDLGLVVAGGAWARTIRWFIAP